MREAAWRFRMDDAGGNITDLAIRRHAGTCVGSGLPRGLARAAALGMGSIAGSYAPVK
jgi:hypothetical protein